MVHYDTLWTGGGRSGERSDEGIEELMLLEGKEEERFSGEEERREELLGREKIEILLERGREELVERRSERS